MQYMHHMHLAYFAYLLHILHILYASTCQTATPTLVRVHICNINVQYTFLFFLGRVGAYILGPISGVGAYVLFLVFWCIWSGLPEHYLDVDLRTAVERSSLQGIATTIDQKQWKTVIQRFYFISCKMERNQNEKREISQMKKTIKNKIRPDSEQSDPKFWSS